MLAVTVGICIHTAHQQQVHYFCSPITSRQDEPQLTWVLGATRFFLRCPKCVCIRAVHGQQAHDFCFPLERCPLQRKPPILVLSICIQAELEKFGTRPPFSHGILRRETRSFLPCYSSCSHSSSHLSWYQLREITMAT